MRRKDLDIILESMRNAGLVISGVEVDGKRVKVLAGRADEAPKLMDPEFWDKVDLTRPREKQQKGGG